MGVDYDLSSLYPHQISMLKVLGILANEVWTFEFAWKPHKSQTSGNLIWLKHAYRKEGTNTWMDSTDYIMYKLSEE